MLTGSLIFTAGFLLGGLLGFSISSFADCISTIMMLHSRGDSMREFPVDDFPIDD